MIATALRFIDWFVPASAGNERSELALARNFIFTHIGGPLLGLSITVFLFSVEERPGWQFWFITGSIVSFFSLPMLLKLSGSIQRTAYLSSQMLTFLSLFGAFHYGGISSPFTPWLLIALLLGFFYVSNRPLLILGSICLQTLGFLFAYAIVGAFPERIPDAQLGFVNLISNISAFIYMAWMAVYYAEVIVQRSEVEREAERHRETAARLRSALTDAEKASHAKSIFLAKISHELRTPLNAVIGYSELVMEDLEDDDSKTERLSDVRRINGAGRHLLEMVNNVLDVSQIESDRHVLEVQEVDLDKLFDGVVATTERLVQKNNNLFETEFDGRLGTAMTDSVKLRQCLLNLLSNAAKFCTEGTITLTVAKTVDGNSEWLEASVRDTGIGISPENLEKLFDSFTQADATIARDFGGSGLGLMLTMRFANLMGGTVTAQSVLGEGSTFSMRLPVDASHLAAGDEIIGEAELSQATARDAA